MIPPFGMPGRFRGCPHHEESRATTGHRAVGMAGLSAGPGPMSRKKGKSTPYGRLEGKGEGPRRPAPCELPGARFGWPGACIGFQAAEAPASSWKAMKRRKCSGGMSRPRVGVPRASVSLLGRSAGHLLKGQDPLDPLGSEVPRAAPQPLAGRTAQPAAGHADFENHGRFSPAAMSPDGMKQGP